MNNKTLNNDIEIALRLLILLEELKAEVDFQRLIFYDYAILHSEDFDASQTSLIPSSPFRKEELNVKTELIQNALSLLSKKQLIDINFAKTGIFYIHAPLDSIHSGIGINTFYDRAGFEESIGLKINYSYFLNLKNKNNKLGLGIGVSLMDKSIDFSRAVLVQPNDPLIPYGVSESGLIPDIDLGAIYQSNKQYYLGLSVTNLLQSKVEIGNISYRQKRYLYTTGGYSYKMLDDGHKKIELIPTFLLKSNLVNLQAEANARVEVNNLYWAGISLRYQDAIAAVAGINYKGFRLGASYDLTVGNLTGASKGSLEFFVGFCQPLEKIKTLHFNTRYL